MSIPRKIRGILRNALTWATTWGGAGAVLHGLAQLIGWGGFLMNGWVPEVLTFMSMGFIGGATFSIGLTITEGKRSLESLSVGWSTSWGAVAGLVGPLLVAYLGSDLTWAAFSTTWPVFLGMTVFGAGSGSLMAVIAKRTGRRDDLVPALSEDRLVTDG